MKRLLIVVVVIVVACGPSQRADTPIIPVPPKDENNMSITDEDDGVPKLCRFVQKQQDWVDEKWEIFEVYECNFDGTLICSLYRWRDKAYIECE